MFARPFVPIVKPLVIGLELVASDGVTEAIIDGSIVSAEDKANINIKAIAIVFPYIFVDFKVFPKNCIFLFSFFL
jgi:hypothetical protein